MRLPTSDTQKPLVSFIVPCFNQGKYLFQALDSIRSGYSGLKEIFVINDASDEVLTQQKLRQLSSRYPEVRLINHEVNKGLSASRNDGLARATGEYIQFLDADDTIFPKKVDYQVHQLTISNNVDVSISDFRVYDENLSSWYTFPKSNDRYRLDLDDFLFRWEKEFIIPIHSALFRKRIFDNIRFDETLIGKEDWIFWCAVAGKGRKLGYVPILGAAYRRHDQAMTINRKTEMADAYTRAYELISKIIVDDEKRILFLQKSKEWLTAYYA